MQIHFRFHFFFYKHSLSQSVGRLAGVMSGIKRGQCVTWTHCTPSSYGADYLAAGLVSLSTHSMLIHSADELWYNNPRVSISTSSSTISSLQQLKWRRRRWRRRRSSERRWWSSRELWISACICSNVNYVMHMKNGVYGSFFSFKFIQSQRAAIESKNNICPRNWEHYCTASNLHTHPPRWWRWWTFGRVINDLLYLQFSAQPPVWWEITREKMRGLELIVVVTYFDQFVCAPIIGWSISQVHVILMIW